MPPFPQQSDSSSADTRYFPRWEVVNRVLFQLEHDPQEREANTKDLSCAGACLNIGEDFIPKQNINLTVFLDKATTVKLQGRIVWMKVIDRETFLGINFINTPHDAQNLILDYAFTINKKDVLKHWYQDWST